MATTSDLVLGGLGLPAGEPTWRADARRSRHEARVSASASGEASDAVSRAWLVVSVIETPRGAEQVQAHSEVTR